MFAKRKANGLDIGLADCLELADKREIIAKTKLLWESLGFSSVRALERSFKDVQQIRDDLAHGQLLDGGREWTDVIARMLEIEALLNASISTSTITRSATS